jgi:hypothetical protein
MYRLKKLSLNQRLNKYMLNNCRNKKVRRKNKNKVVESSQKRSKNNKSRRKWRVDVAAVDNQLWKERELNTVAKNWIFKVTFFCSFNWYFDEN